MAIVRFESAPARGIALIVAGALALLGIAAAQTAIAPSAHAVSGVDEVVYDAIPATLAPNYVSQGYQATRTGEFGQALTLARAGALKSVSVVFSSWTCETGAWNTNDCETTPGATSPVPITVNVYAEGSGGNPGALLASSTQSIAVPYRPSRDTTNYTAGKWWDGSVCSNGLAFTSAFPFSSVEIPANVIVGIAYSTKQDGPAPTGTNGIYSALNVALSYGGDLPTTVGSAGDVYVNSAIQAGYFCDTIRDGGIAVGSFHASPLWGESGGEPCAPLGIELALAGTPTPSDPEPPAPDPSTLPQTPPATSATGADGQPITPPAPPATPPVPGGSLPVSFAAGTFLPYEWVQFVFYSTPTFSASIQASATGALSGSITVPSSLAGGSHTLTATGTTSGVVVASALTVAALPATGLDAGQMWLTGMFGAGLLLLGLVGVIGVEIRRRSKTSG